MTRGTALAMDERYRAKPKDDDVPIIGDYSEAANARIRAESQSPPIPPLQREPARGEPEPTPTATRPADGQWRVDPRDVRRYAKLKRQRENVGRLGKISRYGLGVVALAAAFLVYWNFETLRSIDDRLFGANEPVPRQLRHRRRRNAASGRRPQNKRIRSAASRGCRRSDQRGRPAAG